MPTIASSKIPAPSSWNEFEDIVADVFEQMWDDHSVVRNGRTGQRQNGVDIYGHPQYLGGDVAGIQCKDKEIKLAEIESEILQAEKFTPVLKEFIFAVASSRDAAIQEEVRKIDAERRSQAKFPVAIYFWEDLALKLSGSEKLVRKHYPHYWEDIPAILSGPQKGKDEPVEIVSYDQIIKAIADSDPDDWLYLTESEGDISVYTFKKNVDLRIWRDSNTDREFREDWATSFPDPDARFCSFWVYYCNSPIMDVSMVAVDGYRAFMPLPALPEKDKPLKINRFQAVFARIVNSKGFISNYDTFFRWANFVVEDDAKHVA